RNGADLIGVVTGGAGEVTAALDVIAVTREAGRARRQQQHAFAPQRAQAQAYRLFHLAGFRQKESFRGGNRFELLVHTWAVLAHGDDGGDRFGGDALDEHAPVQAAVVAADQDGDGSAAVAVQGGEDRKSTRLNSSHVK